MDPMGPNAVAPVAAASADTDTGKNHHVGSLVPTNSSNQNNDSIESSSAEANPSVNNMSMVPTAPSSLPGPTSGQQQPHLQQQQGSNVSTSSSSSSSSSVSSSPALVPVPARTPAAPSDSIAPSTTVAPTVVVESMNIPALPPPAVVAETSTAVDPGLLQPVPTSTTNEGTAPLPPIDRAHSPRLPSRPVRLIRNLHANYFNASKQPCKFTDSFQDTNQNTPARIVSSCPIRQSFASNHTSAVGQAIASLQRTVYAFGASSSIVGCCALLFQSYEGHVVSGPKLWIQLAYYGLFAAACSWQCIAPALLPSSEPLPSLPSKKTPEWVTGYSALSLLSSPLLFTSSTLFSFVSSPIVRLLHWAPVIVAPLLYGLGAISAAAEKDQDQHQKEVSKLKESHEQLLESYRNDNLLRKNMLLETVGKEVQDAAALAMESLRHMTPNSLFPPNIPREQLTPCTIPVPITSVLGLFTTLRHLQYIARNMQRLSRVLFTEYVQGIVEKTSPHYHRGDTGFDVGEFVQSIGDLVSADASLKGIELVIYHTEYELNHVQIKGSEDSWRHALINLIKSIMDWGKPGSTVELCLNLSALPQPGQTGTKVLVSFEITYIPNPAMSGDVDDLSELNALLASKLVKAMGGSLVIEETESRGRRFIVAVEVEVNTPASNHSHRTGTSTPILTEGQGSRSIENVSAVSSSLSPSHLLVQDNSPAPSQPGSPKPGHITLNDLTLLPPKDHHAHHHHHHHHHHHARASPSLDQRLEQMQTAHQEHPSRQFYEQHTHYNKLRTPVASPSGVPSSPSPRRGGPVKISQEPTVQDLLRFSRKLSGVRIVLWAKESSAFAMRLSGYLRAWGINLIQMEIPDNQGSTNGKPNGWATSQDDRQHMGTNTAVLSPVPKRSSSSSSLSSHDTGSPGAKSPKKNGSDAGEVGSASSSATTTTASSSNPAGFVFIDDDVNILSEQIMRLQASPPSPSQGIHSANSSINHSKRPSHRRNKSISTIQQTHIIYFTSLPTFKQARETIMTVLNAHNPGFHYNIMSTPPSPGSNVPYILVLPKPAGPRRILTAIHTAINSPVLDNHFSPIATAPTPPAPLIRRFSEEANPMETTNYWIDPDTKLAYAGRPTMSTTHAGTHGGSPGQSPNHSIQAMRQDNVQQPIVVGANLGAARVSSALDSQPVTSPLTSRSTPPVVGSPKAGNVPTVPTSAATVASPGGSISEGVSRVPASSAQSTATTTAITTVATIARAIPSPTPQMQNYKRRSGGMSRVSAHTIIPNNGEGIVIVPNSATNPSFTQPFSTMASTQWTNNGNHRNSVGSDGLPTPVEPGRRTPSYPFATTPTSTYSNNPVSTPSLGFMQSPSGEYIISPPMARHANMSSTLANSPSTTPGTRTSMISESGTNPSPPFVSPGLERTLATTPIMESPVVGGSASHLESAAAAGSRSPGSPAPRINPVSPLSVNKSTRSASSSLDATTKLRIAQQIQQQQQQLSSAAAAAKKNGVVERVSPLINVLIVEDNYINQRLLAKFMQQKHIKYDVASNGKEAVDKWKAGGFHLILMDIQMPVMDGIEATKQIREMERLQRIGVTGSTYSSSPDPEKMSNGIGGNLDNSPTTSSASTPSSSPFKSPVVIVALTAAAENDDTRDIALAAGCNDFITKPVSNVWLERKIVDWGCMQALIDIEGWKKWKQELEATNAANNRKALASSTAAAGIGGGNGSSEAGSGSGGASAAGGGTLPNIIDGKKSIGPSISRLTAKRPSISMRSIKGLRAPLKRDKEKVLASNKDNETTTDADGPSPSGTLAAATAADAASGAAAKDAKAAETPIASVPIPAPASGDTVATPAP